MPKPRVKRPVERIAARWVLSKRGYYYRICSGVVVRLTWHDFKTEDGWFLTYGNGEEYHRLENGSRMGWGNLQAAWRYAEERLNELGLIPQEEQIHE